MSQNIRRAGLATIAVVLVFVSVVFIDSVVVTIELKRMAAGHQGPDLLNRSFPWFVLLIASSIIPSFVLQMCKISRCAAYLVVGALSGWFGAYSFWFEFGQTFTLFTAVKARAFSAVLVDAFTNMAKLEVDLSSENFWAIPVCCLVGLFCGWLYWLLAVRRVWRR